jgi:putative membrane protein
MKKRFNPIKALIHALEGAIVGVGAILPGVSGGVLCVSFGVYEPMMELFTEPKKALKKNYDMFIPFVLGWALGFVLLAGVMEAFFSFAPDVAIMLFFGLVCGTLPELFKKSEQAKANSSWLPFVVSLAVSYVFFHVLDSNDASLNVGANFLSFVFCGFMWGISLIVPGLSSSTVLIYLGLYVPLTEGISGFDLSVLIPFGIGIIVTVLLFAKLVNMLFKKHYALISRMILGFVISSSLKTLPDKFGSAWSMIISIVCFGLGFALAVLMDRAERKQIQKNGG